MALNCLFAALYAALSILLGCAAVFAGQVLVKQPSVSFCKFPARAGQPPRRRRDVWLLLSPEALCCQQKQPLPDIPGRGCFMCLTRWKTRLYPSVGHTGGTAHGPSLNTGGRRL